MIRALADELALFLLPFVVFAGYLLLRRRNPLAFSAWEHSVPWLVLAGVGLIIATLVFTGLTAPRSLGRYVPPHVENGRIVPGHFE